MREKLNADHALRDRKNAKCMQFFIAINCAFAMPPWRHLRLNYEFQPSLVQGI
jgi:hypothetical protein